MNASLDYTVATNRSLGMVVRNFGARPYEAVVRAIWWILENHQKGWVALTDFQTIVKETGCDEHAPMAVLSYLAAPGVMILKMEFVPFDPADPPVTMVDIVNKLRECQLAKSAENIEAWNTKAWSEFASRYHVRWVPGPAAFSELDAPAEITDIHPWPPRQISCGCCTNGCVCWNHQDTPRGQPPSLCAYHVDHHDKICPSFAYSKTRPREAVTS